MAEKTNISFYHLKGALSTATLESGAIYFSDADHTIGVYDGTNMQKYYGGNVKNAVYADKKLTISYYDGTDAVLDFNDVASASGVTSLLSGLRDNVTTLEGKVNTLEGDSHTHTNKTVLDGITSDKVTAWDAVASKKSTYDTHVDATDIHVSTTDRTNWNNKQAALSADQLAAANSGITADKVSGYDSHIIDTDIHVSTTDRTNWNAAEQNAKDYADGLAKNYDAAGAADTALASAKSYADGLAKNYDAAGAAAQALADAKAYTNGEIGKLGTAAKKDVLTGAIADSTSDDLVTAAQVKAYASGVVGAMHFRGAVENTGAIADPASGDICLVGTKEYVYNGADWVLFGDEGAYDTKGSAAQALTDAKSYADGLASNYATANHNHDTVYSKLGHTHATSEITGLDDALAGKAAASHTHAISEVTDLQTTLDGKAASVHTHAIADVNGLQAALDGKAASDHNHDTVYSKLDHNHDDAYDAKGAAATVKTEVIGNANTDTKDSNTIVGAKKYTDDAIAAATLVWKQF